MVIWIDEVGKGDNSVKKTIKLTRSTYERQLIYEENYKPGKIIRSWIFKINKIDEVVEVNERPTRAT